MQNEDFLSHITFNRGRNFRVSKLTSSISVSHLMLIQSNLQILLRLQGSKTFISLLFFLAFEISLVLFINSVAYKKSRPSRKFMFLSKSNNHHLKKYTIILLVSLYAALVWSKLHWQHNESYTNIGPKIVLLHEGL